MGEAGDHLIGGDTLLDFATEAEPVDDAEREKLTSAYEEYADELEQTMVSNDT